MKTFKFGESKIFLHQDDLPAKIKTPKIIAIDTETTGLSLIRDRLCLIQFAFSKEECHLVQFSKKKSKFNNKNLKVLKILNDHKIQKIFHYARFDVAILRKTFQANIENIFCTKLASKLVRTYTDSHGLKNLVQEFCNKSLDKRQGSSDWNKDIEDLTDKQLEYAANDVIYLHKIKIELEKMLIREKRMGIFNECLAFLETRVALDQNGFKFDIFEH